MGIAALVLGIAGIVLDVFGLGIFGAVLGLIGVILGAVGKKSDANLATPGLVVSIIALVLGLIFYIACAACYASALGALL